MMLPSDLGHLAALVVADEAVQIDATEGDIVHEHVDIRIMRATQKNKMS